jgi:hypothetical protein
VERIVIKDLVAGRRPKRTWIQDVKETLNISIDEVGVLVR